MLRQIAWRNVRANPVRFLGTVLAVVLATTFLSAALTARDSLSDALTTNAVQALQDVDLVVEAEVDEDDPDQDPGGGQFGVEEEVVGLDVDLLDRVETVDGVAAAVGQARGLVGLPDALGNPVDLDAFVVDDSPLQPWTADEGRLPAASGEIAVDRQTAAGMQLEVGDEVAMATALGTVDATVVGLSEFGDQAARGQGEVLVPVVDGDAILRLSDQGWTSILVALDDDVDPDAVTDDLLALPTADDQQIEVRTGDELRDEEAGEAASLASGLGIGLQAFAYLALVIGALIIFNTFTTVVAQRTREFALLRAIGTSARQVRRAVRLEALVIAVVASLIGAALGAGLVAIAIAAIPAVGNFTDFALRPLSVLQVLASGIVVTLVSAFIPAWRASRTRPVEAMRDADPTVKPISRGRTITGVVLLAAGAVSLTVGSVIGNWILLGLGATLLFLGVIVGGPTVVAWLARFLRRPLARFSIADELAVAETERNARRTAATANALVIGVFLVVFTTSAGGALRDFAIEQLEGFGGADVSVASFSGEPLSEEVIADVTAVDGLETVSRLNQVVGFVELEGGFGGGATPVAAVEVAEFAALGLDVREGEPSPDGLVVAQELAQASGLELGDTMTVTLLRGEELELEVVATSGFTLDVPPFIMDLDSVAEATGAEVETTGLAASFAGDADHDAVREQVQAITDQYAGVEVLDVNEFVSLLRTFFNFLLSAVAALLGVAVVIALFGILNTLVLAIAERTRELGLLRAVGMTRRQLRRMVRTEALITSVVGTTIGAAMGVLVAFAVVRVALEGAFTWPWAQLGIAMLAGVVTGVLASVFPARRAARMDALEAIRME